MLEQVIRLSEENAKLKRQVDRLHELIKTLCFLLGREERAVELIEETKNET